MSNYTVIGKLDCPWCDRAKDLLDRHGIPYTYLDYELGGPWARFVKDYVGFKTVPQIFNENYELIGGYDHLDGYLNGNYKS